MSQASTPGGTGSGEKIFEANRDVLKDPNLIRVGQKLAFPDSSDPRGCSLLCGGRPPADASPSATE